MGVGGGRTVPFVEFLQGFLPEFRGLRVRAEGRQR